MQGERSEVPQATTKEVESSPGKPTCLSERSEDRIREILGYMIVFIKDYFQMHDIEINGDCKLRADLGLSSFELLEMFCSMEEAMGIDIREDEYKKFTKVSTIYDVAKCLYFAAK